MNIVSYLEEKDVPFLRVPKCIRSLLGRDCAELFALIREKRNYLVSNKIIKNHDSWFFYTNNDMQEDFGLSFITPSKKENQTTSLNSIKKLLDRLEETKLISTKVERVEKMSVQKFYKTNDDVYERIIKQAAEKRTESINQWYDEERQRKEAKR